MGYKEHAMQEFKAAGWLKEDGTWCDEMQELICTQLLELLELFGNHGHSGSSAPYAVRLFENLALFKPIVPLTGEDSEWNEIVDGEFQNRRCSHVFKSAGRHGGQAYDVEGRVFRESDGVCYTNRDSEVAVTFPYTPTTEYVDRPEE